jgi:hypothetical protein
MANTTYFGWETPDDTDLVKDGAAAIRTLGSAIDASMQDLEGGTSGQILSKNSNTDMDFVWINNDQGDITEVQAGTGISVASGTGPIPVITNTVATEFDAKGDLVVGTGADTFDKLTVGANDTILVADSSTATGLKWAAPAGGGANWSLLNAGGTALTGAQTITVSGISGKDKILVMVVKASSVNASTRVSIRLNTDTGSNYYLVGGANEYSSTYNAANFSINNGLATTSFGLGKVSTNAAEAVWGYALLSGCNSSGVKVVTSAGQGSGGSGHEGTYLGGYYDSSSTISSISVFSSTGNFDDGTVYVYTSA